MFCLATPALDIISYDPIYPSRILPVLLPADYQVSMYVSNHYSCSCSCSCPGHGQAASSTGAAVTHNKHNSDECRARLLCNLSEYKTTAARFRQGVDSSSQTPPNSLPAVLRLHRWPPPRSRRIGFPPLGWPPDERPGPPFSALLRYLSPTENQPTGLQAYMPACRPRKVDVIQPRQPLRPQTQVLRRGTLPLLQPPWQHSNGRSSIM